MADPNTLAAVLRHAQRWIPNVSGPESDLVLLTLGDVGRLGQVLEGLYKDFNIEWPMVADAQGRLLPAKLHLDEHLTVSQLADIVQSGAWPKSWTRPGVVLSGPSGGGG